MKKSLFGLLAILVVLSMVLAGCGAEPEPTEAPSVEPTQAPAAQPTSAGEATEPSEPKADTLEGTITLWQSWKEEEIAGLNEVIAAFQEMHPNVQFDVLYVPFDDLKGKFETAAATGGGPDVLIGAADWGPSLYDAELIADIGGMADEAFLRTINSAALGAVRYKGALIGLPETIKGVVMFRNTSIIADAPATVSDLVAAAQAATQGDVVGANLERGFFFSAAHLNGIGGQLMTESGDPAFNNDKGVEWINLLQSFADAGPTEYYTDNDVNLFKAGNAGIIIDGTWNMSGLAEAIGADNLAIDPWPAADEGHMSGYVQTENIYLGANVADENRDAAWTFMEFFLGADAQSILTGVGHIPAISGVEVTDPLMAQAVEAFAGGAVFPVIPEMGAYWESMDTALQSVFDEGTDPAAALAQAEQSIQAKIAELRGEAPPVSEMAGTITLWQSWKEEEIAGLNEVIAAFQGLHPNVQFDVLYVPFDDLKGKFETAAATGGGPDVLIGAADWGPGLYDAELIADVSGRASAPFLASINEAAVGAVRYKGALIGLPETIKGVVMFRNPSIVPDAPATCEDLIAAAQAATQGDVVGANLERGFFFSAAHLNGLGGELMTESGDPAFNSDKGVEWLNVLQSFADAGPVEYYTDNDVNLFKAGNAGIIVDGTWNMAGLVEAVGAENVVIDPWPACNDGHLSGFVQTENIYLSANSTEENATAAWAFMEFFLGADAQAMLANVGHIPAISGVEVTDPLMLQAVEAFAGGAAFPVIPEMGAYWESMDTALQTVFDEGTDPAEALAAAEESINAKIAELRGGQ